MMQEYVRTPPMSWKVSYPYPVHSGVEKYELIKRKTLPTLPSHSEKSQSQYETEIQELTNALIAFVTEQLYTTSQEHLRRSLHEGQRFVSITKDKLSFKLYVYEVICIWDNCVLVNTPCEGESFCPPTDIVHEEYYSYQQRSAIIQQFHEWVAEPKKSPFTEKQTEVKQHHFY